MIVVSTELDEVAALADRIAVMYRGGIVGIVPGDTSRDVLGLMMADLALGEDCYPTLLSGLASPTRAIEWEAAVTIATSIRSPRQQAPRA